MQLKRINVVFCLMLALIFACPRPGPGRGRRPGPVFQSRPRGEQDPHHPGKSRLDHAYRQCYHRQRQFSDLGYFSNIDGNAINPIAKLTDFSGTVDINFNIPVKGEVRGAI